MFGLFRRRRSKWEVARDAVSEALHTALEHLPLETIEDKLEVLKDEAAEAAARGSKKTQGLSRKAGTLAAAKAAIAADTAGHVAARAGDAAEAARETLSDTFGKVRGSASHLAHGAHEKIEHLRHAAPAIEMPTIEVPKLLRKGKTIREAHEDAMETAHDALEKHYPQVEVSDTSSKWLWFAVGLGVGAVVALLLAPAAGRRSRAVIKDKLHQGQREASEIGKAAAEKAADLSRRTVGKAHELTSVLHGDDADDVTVADRVRTELGQLSIADEMERFNIDCVEGIVTVRGPMVETAQNVAIEAAVRSVPGVRDVKMELLISDATEDEATFVG